MLFLFARDTVFTIKMVIKFVVIFFPYRFFFRAMNGFLFIIVSVIAQSYFISFYDILRKFRKTVNIGTYRLEQSVQTWSSLISVYTICHLQEESVLVLHCLPFHLHLLDALLY